MTIRRPMIPSALLATTLAILAPTVAQAQEPSPGSPAPLGDLQAQLEQAFTTFGQSAGQVDQLLELAQLDAVDRLPQPVGEVQTQANELLNGDTSQVQRSQGRTGEALNDTTGQAAEVVQQATDLFNQSQQLSGQVQGRARDILTEGWF